LTAESFSAVENLKVHHGKYLMKNVLL